MRGSRVDHEEADNDWPRDDNSNLLLLALLMAPCSAPRRRSEVRQMLLY
jgi:hypothetical protein